MQNSSEDESAFSAVTRLPITPFSSLLNDLNRPFFLNNLHPSAEIVRTAVNFPEIIEKPEAIPTELFNCSSFNPSKIILNVAPVKEITHNYDDFMLKVLEDCYEVQATSHVKQPEMTIPNPIVSTPVKQKASSKPVHNTETVSTPSTLKVKLNVAGGSSNNGLVLNKLIQEGSFVNPLCFDCEEDLSQIARVISSFSLSPPQSTDLELFESINETLSKYIEEVVEHLDQSSESIDSVKAAYCMSLIGLLNVGRLSTKELLKDYNSFDMVMKFSALCSSDSFDLILSVVIESYVALLTRFKIHDAEISSYSTHLFDLCFESSGPLSKTSSIIALSQVFSKYSEYRSYIIDQLLMKSSDAEYAETQKLGATIILACLQALCNDSNALNLVSSIMSSCLSYCWKGEGNELPKGTNIFFALIDELLNVFSNCRWPVAAVALNQCTIQMFHYLLKDETSAQKGSLFLKLKLLDILANISKVVSSDSEPVEKRSNWLLISQNSWFSSILSPKTAFESLYQNAEVPTTFDQEFYSNFLRSGPLSKVPERVIGLLIKLISSEVIQLRSKAIKNLFNLMNSSQLCESNYNALKASILMKAADPSISVRDASLDFISKMIFSPLPYDDGPKELIDSVISRIKDRGVSVRKRAVKVIGEILMKGVVDGTEMKLTCIGNLISHISDEEDEVVVEMIFKTLKEQWIMCYIGKDFLTILPAAQRKIMATFADEVVKVIGFLQSDIKCLQDFLGRFLIDASIKKEYSIFFSGTIEVLLENLLQTLEANDTKSLKRSLESISLFSESNPQSLENHLALLQNLLRSEDAEISFLAMKLIAGVIPKASLSELKKLQDFEKDLLVLIYRGSEVAVKQAIGTLYHYVNNCSHQYAILSGLWQKFTDYLKTRMNDQEIDPSTIPHICRALLATGVLCAQSALHREKEFGLKDFHSGAQARCLLEFISVFSKAPVAFIRSCTIQAFGSLLLASPQISISSAQLVRTLIVSSLSESEDDSCKLKMLGIFDQMIKIFNVETEKDPNCSNNTKNDILSMEGEESYFSALIQEHLTLISNCVISSSGLEVQASALKICSSSAILGLVNPQLIIPYLAIGLNSDNDHIQSYSRNSYERLLTRFPSMMSKDLLTPSKLLYRQLTVGKSSDTTLITNDKINSKLSFYYSSLRGKTGKVGIEALNGVFSWFEEIVTSKTNSSVVDVPIKLINFIIEIIFTLPFSNSEEVLNCLQKIQGIFSIASDSDDSLLKEKFAILNGLSYSVNYLIKSYPQVHGMSIDENLQTKTLQRNILPFELPKITTDDVTNETIQNLISNQSSIPVLLLQEPKTKRRQSQNFTKFEEVDVDDVDITEFLVDDEEISESESDSEDDFLDIEGDFEPPKPKKQQVQKKKPALNQNKKQKRK